MKSDRGGSRGARREQILSGMEKDSYKSPRKLPESSRCPQCGATFFKDRWTWKPALADSPAHICPACHRIKDKFPAGYVTLNGEYLTAHRDEIVSLAKHCESREKTNHPLQRIMSVEAVAGSMLITTTDVHLARNIAERIHGAHKGELSLNYSKEENLLRATWKR
jgi:hypothetical protein